MRRGGPVCPPAPCVARENTQVADIYVWPYKTITILVSQPVSIRRVTERVGPKVGI